MAEIIICTFICILNVIMWIIFANKFKKLFSTDDIIAKTREELNHMIIDVNRNADRNITLIDEKIKELKSVTAEAERRIALGKAELAKTEKAKVLEQSLAQEKKPKEVNRSALSATGRYKHEQEQGDLFTSTSLEKKKSNSVALDEEQDHVHEIPIVVPKVYLSENPVVPQKDFNTLVKEKYDQGKSVEDIAAELGRSTQEVKFALEF